MKKHYLKFFKKQIAIFAFSFLMLSIDSIAQLPCKVLVGYWQNSWGTYVRLKDVNSNYNVICLAFLGAESGSINDLEFTPDPYFGGNNIVANLKTDIVTSQNQGKIVLMSIGGAAGSFKLNSTTDKNTFVSKVKSAIQDYGVDGIDIDLEQRAYLDQEGTISNPSAHIAYVIQGIQELLTWYQTTYGKKMILTMAPECLYTTGGLSTFQVSSGVPYLAIIEALRNDIDLLMVQLYNATESNDLNGTTYSEGTADFVVSQTEALIRGFTCKSGKGVYSGLPANKVVVALPAAFYSAAGYVTPAVAKSAVKYLMGTGSKPGSYTLVQSGGYPDLAGMMTWSINEDLDNGYAFATNYASIFGSSSSNCTITANKELEAKTSFGVYPNPANGQLTVVGEHKGLLSIYNALGQVVLQQNINQGANYLDISALSKGFYFVGYGTESQKLIVE